MTGLVEFYLARLAEREQVARAASPGPWSPDADGYEVLAADGVTVAGGFALSGPQLRATVQHIALNNPEQVLEDLAAKQRIVRQHTHYETEVLTADDEENVTLCRECMVDFPCDTLRLLALPFAAHPGYDEAWRPS